jgi:hypothetical protein
MQMLRKKVSSLIMKFPKEVLTVRSSKVSSCSVWGNNEKLRELFTSAAICIPSRCRKEKKA